MIASLPDRRWIEKVYLPSLTGRVLYVGVGFYTAHYPVLARGASEFWFLDRDHANADRFGGGRCFCGEFLEHRSAAPYDHVALYGLVGFGSTLADFPRMIAHADSLLAPLGTLLLGPNKRPRAVRQLIDYGEEGVPLVVPEDVQLAVLGRPAWYWRALFEKPPLDGYTVLVEDRDLPEIETNYVWWGRKGPG